jgi:hypothetical protein
VRFQLISKLQAGWNTDLIASAITYQPTIKQLDLCYFQLDIVECLLSDEKAERRSRGRASEAALSAEQPCIKRRCKVRPPTAVCLDTVDHLLSKDNNEHSSRCKNQNCMKKTHTHFVKNVIFIYA